MSTAPRPPRHRSRLGLAALVLTVPVALVGCSDLVPGATDGSPSSQHGASTSDAGGASDEGGSTTAAAKTADTATDAVDWASVASRVEPSVVAISVRGASGEAAGSGVVLDADGHIVTNHHVIAGAAGGGQIRVTLADDRVLTATVLGSDAESDLAVLQLKDPPEDLTPIRVSDSSALAVGDPVMAVGNPLGLSGTVTTGIVSSLDRPVTTQGDELPQGESEPVVTNAIQTSAAINPGNSGGALVDASGRLIGINSSIATVGEQSGSIGIGFAITAQQVTTVTDQILHGGTVHHARMGVSATDALATVDGYQHRAAGITAVDAGSAAADAGLRTGDAVTAIDGESVDSALALVAQVRERPVGSTVTLTVVRDGTEKPVKVRLAAQE